MWLIDTHSLALKRFQDDRKAVGKYAILSHRWQQEEVTFDDLPQGRNTLVPPATRLKFGFDKIENACTQAREDGYRYLWADTACINKQSSAELSEAIASMWRWYSDAAVCYAYLCDVDFNDPSAIERDEVSNKTFLHLLRPSVWFRRGWTLQELIAPSEVLFFDKTWRRIGFKTEMSKILENITGIGENALLNRDMVNVYCVAKRMAWAARRQTTRVEDEAYCLLGIFNVSMPMMYGEGRRAFLRLQEEIVRSTTDHSIFAWMPSPSGAARHFSALLAPDSSCFRALRLQKQVVRSLVDEHLELTKQALRICLPVHVVDDCLIALLNCMPRRAHNRDEAVVLVLKKLEQQSPVTPSQKSRIVCEIERSSNHPLRMSRAALEPLEWMDLTILRQGLTPEVGIEIRLEQTGGTRIVGSHPPPDESDNMIVLKNPTGRLFSACHVILGHTHEHEQSSRYPVYLSVGQCLGQEDSFATFRMHWSAAPITAQQLFLQQHTKVASAWLSGGLMTARAALHTDSSVQYHRPRWVISIRTQAIGVPLNTMTLVVSAKPQAVLEKELSKLRKEYRRGLRRLERARESFGEDDVSAPKQDDGED